MEGFVRQTDILTQSLSSRGEATDCLNGYFTLLLDHVGKQGLIQVFGLRVALAGGLGTEVPQQRELCSGEGLEAKLPEARRMLRHEAKKPPFYVSSHFCLKIQNAVCGLQSQRNGPQWQPRLIKRVP